MTPQETLDFYREQAEFNGEWAERHHAAGNVVHALQNWSWAAGNWFFRALVGWRTGLADPLPDLRAAVEQSEAAAAFINSTDVGRLRAVFGAVPGAYAAILLDEPDRPVVGELDRLAQPKVPRNVPPDVALDAWLARALTGGDPTDGRRLTAEIGARRRLGLVGDTFTTYFELLALGRATTDRVIELTRTSLALFGRRRRNDYYAGGINYLGGDLDNELVVDFHLAAIWRVRGWDSSGLTDEERRHVVRP